MGDCTNALIRQFIMKNTSIDHIEAFPERDNENKRVFKEVKMSVCILAITKTRVPEFYKFPVRIHHDKFIDESNEAMMISYNDTKLIDGTNHTIPLVKQRELQLLLKMNKDCKKMTEYSKCYTGEIDISLDKQYITTSRLDDLMLRGAQVQKYYISNKISQGDILYLKGKAYLANNSGARSRHHERRRIVMQGITGINEKWRLKMTIVDAPYYCANSVNYLLVDNTDNFDYVILGILNSKLLNWYFSKLSTNSNVNGYEIDGLPIKIGTIEQQNMIKALVEKETQNHDTDVINSIDEIVYRIYDITEYEIPVIEN